MERRRSAKSSEEGKGKGEKGGSADRAAHASVVARKKGAALGLARGCGPVRCGGLARVSLGQGRANGLDRGGWGQQAGLASWAVCERGKGGLGWVGFGLSQDLGQAGPGSGLVQGCG